MGVLEPVRLLTPHGNPVERMPPGLRPRTQRFEGRYVAVEPLDHRRDGDSLYAASREDDSLWAYLPYGPFAEDAFRAHLRGFTASADPCFYVITPSGADGPQGMASLMTIEPLQGTIEIGHIMLGSPLQRTVAATEGLFLLMKHAMDDLGNRRLEWKCDAANGPSRNAARRFGFAFEGIFAQHRIVKGRNRDTAWYSITDGEWPAIRSCFEQWLDPSNFDGDGRQRIALRDLTGAFREHREVTL
ncbi:MAG: GNAT family N-acetyltransferase [Thermomicrobiales bacterium]|nr:GNAT family N-acetyltransferase [Thermomicrobiales bacterium]